MSSFNQRTQLTNEHSTTALNLHTNTSACDKHSNGD